MAPDRDQWSDLTAFQRDLLYAIAGFGDEDPKGLAVKGDLEQYYPSEVHHARLYGNLDELVDAELVSKGSKDDRTNAYALTNLGRDFLQKRREWQNERAGDVLGLDDHVDPGPNAVEPEVEEEVEQPAAWCGRCGEGPLTERGVVIHTGHVHTGDPIVLHHEPDENELEGDGTEKDALDADAKADVDEMVQDAGEDPVTAADGGAAAAADVTAEPNAPDLGVPDEPPESWDEMPFPIPDNLTLADLRTAVDEYETIAEIAAALDMRRARVRTLVHKEGLYTEVREGRL